MTSQVLDRQVAAMVSEIVDAYGVPTGLDSARATANALHPSMIDLRHEAARIERAGMWVEPAGVRPYPTTAVDAVTRRAAGLEPNPELAQVDMFDPATRSMQRVSVAPYAAPMSEEVVAEYSRRMIAAVQRHVAAAGRDLVRDTARQHRMAYARTLGYSESGNCAFCSMLAGRGAVYASEDSAGAGTKWHDNCTCDVRLVDGSDWDGRDRDLEALWAQSDGTLEDYRRVWREYTKEGY